MERCHPIRQSNYPSHKRTFKQSNHRRNAYMVARYRSSRQKTIKILQHRLRPPFYAATHKDDLRNKYLQNVNKIPIIVSEYGICDASGNGNIDEANAKQWIDLLNKNQTGRILWNASNKQETSSILVPDANMETWSLSDLSPTGHWLLDQANQKKPIKSEKRQKPELN